MLTEQQQAQLGWEKRTDLLPVVVQHAVSSEVLMLGYMNRGGAGENGRQRQSDFFSRTKRRLWTKGKPLATSECG